MLVFGGKNGGDALTKLIQQTMRDSQEAEKEKSMRTYYITVPVTRATGKQFWRVEAENEAEALELWNNGQALFEGDELEVQETGKPVVSTDE